MIPAVQPRNENSYTTSGTSLQLHRFISGRMINQATLLARHSNFIQFYYCYPILPLNTTIDNMFTIYLQKNRKNLQYHLSNYQKEQINFELRWQCCWLLALSSNNNLGYCCYCCLFCTGGWFTKKIKTFTLTYIPLSIRETKIPLCFKSIL